MSVSNVNATAAAYQGSGLEKSKNPELKTGLESEKAMQMEQKLSAEPKVRENKEQFEIQKNAKSDSVKRAVEEINRKAKNSEAIFGIHDKTNRVMIKIVDKETKETIKEFPPEQTLDMIAKVWELAGLMVDEKR